MLQFMKKIIHKDNRKLWLLLIISFFIAAVSLPTLPKQIPIHFDVSGNVDSYGSRGFIFIAPFFSFFLILMAEAARHFDPKKENYSFFQKHYYSFFFLIGLLLFSCEIYTLWYCYFPNKVINISDYLIPCIGLLFAYMGNIMPKFKHNYFIGIRTPQTLSNEKVWYRTHRFTGKIWFAGGILTVLTIFLPKMLKVWAFFAIALLLAVLPFLYSFLIYKKIVNEDKH